MLLNWKKNGNESGIIKELEAKIAELEVKFNTITNTVESITNFSMEEKIVGKWHDGKTIYEKTMVAGNTSVAGLNIETLIKMDTHTTNPTANVPDNSQWHGGSDVSQAILLVGAKTIQIDTSTGGTTYVTIRYTKTTDTRAQ